MSFSVNDVFVGTAQVVNGAKIGAAAATRFGAAAGTATTVAGTGGVGATVGAAAQVASNGIDKLQGKEVSLTDGVAMAATIGAVAGTVAASASTAVAPAITAAGKARQLAVPAVVRARGSSRRQW